MDHRNDIGEGKGYVCDDMRPQDACIDACIDAYIIGERVKHKVHRTHHHTQCKHSIYTL